MATLTMRWLDSRNEWSLPVVHDRTEMKMAGIIHESSLIQAYQEAIHEARDEERGL